MRLRRTDAVQNLGITSLFFPLLLIKRVSDIASNFDYNTVFIYYVRKSDRVKRQQNISKTGKMNFNNWSAFLSFRCNSNLGNAPGYFQWMFNRCVQVSKVTINKLKFELMSQEKQIIWFSFSVLIQSSTKMKEYFKIFLKICHTFETFGWKL